MLASKRFPNYFYDEKSLQFEAMPQVCAVNAKSSEYTMLASVARYHNMDNMVRQFFEKNPDGIAVTLGAGLETMNYRLKSCAAHFYQVDFPAVIQAREKLLGKAKNETFIESDITDISWTKHIDTKKPVLLIASGVFQYFKPEAVSVFLGNMKKCFSSPQLIFDATDEVGIKYAQKYVKKTGNQNAMMYFYVNDIKKFCAQENLRLLEHRGFFKEARATLKGLKLYTKIAMKVVDDKKRTQIFWVTL